MKRLLVHGQFGFPFRSLVGRSSTPPALSNNILPRYHSTEKDDDTLSEIGGKARSTAEEFMRVAKEKSDEVSEGSKETLHETKEAVLGESDDEKEKFKQRVEEGRTEFCSTEQVACSHYSGGQCGDICLQAYKGVASNLVTYLTDVVKMSTSSAAKSVSTWSGVTSMLPLASAILADSYWDRHATITVSSLLYIAGLIGLTSWAVLHSWVPCSLLFFSLYLLSVGQGGYNSSLQAFGAHQLHIEHDMGSGTVKEKDRVKFLFFQWWYFGICSVSLLGNSVMSYIQDTVGWGFGFAITLVGDSDSPFLVVS